MGGEGSFGEREIISNRGEPRREFGGVKRDPPRRTWQVGQILTKREINSLGTLEHQTMNMLAGKSLLASSLYLFKLTKNRFVGPVQRSYPGHRVGIVDGLW